MNPPAGTDDDTPRVRAAAALPEGGQGPTPAGPIRPTRWIVPLVLLAGFGTLTVLNALQGFKPSAAAAETELAALLLDPATARWVLTDTKDSARRPFASVVGDTAGRRLFFAATKLPAPGAGRSYVLWTVGREPNASPRNVGAITIASEARVVLEVSDAPSLRDLASFVVSVEPDPKASSPTVVVASGGG